MQAFAHAEILWLGLASLIAGASTGFLAGLFGVGGGTVVVPALYEVFGFYGVADEVRMPLCVGTSLAIIAPTSISSLRGHLRKGAVEIEVLKIWAAPIVIGVIFGAFVATFAKPFVFKILFIFICALLAVRLFLNRPDWRLSSEMPNKGLMRSFGLAIGFSSALVGIGGGLLANLVMTLYGRPIRAAVATASGVGVCVSVPGAVGYIVGGWAHAGLPPLSLGFVSVLAVALLSPVSVWTAKAGVALAHSLDRRRLEQALAVYLTLISLRFAVTLF